MFIQTEKTPNPATIKFLPGQTVMERGTAEFASAASSTSSPLAQRLFQLQGVARIFFGRDFVSVSKADDTDWSILTPMVLGVLMEHLSTGQPIMTAQAEGGTVPEVDDEITAQIKILIEERVRPMVMMDGGDIVFDSFQDGVVFLQMRGACSGCPSSTATLKQGIETMLKHYVPEVTEVRPVEG
ncbi:MAG TPA: NifU family protein [Rhodospirillaceae bacterium]|nr:NifU family protein [Rhodospirillaceae bacterium]